MRIPAPLKPFLIGCLIGAAALPLGSRLKGLLEATVLDPSFGGPSLFLRSEEVGMLQEGDPVSYNGVRIGRIRSIELQPDASILVTAQVAKTARIYATPVATIQPIGFEGRQMLRLQDSVPHGRFRNVQEPVLSSKDTLEAVRVPGLLERLMRSPDVFLKIDSLYQVRHACDSLRSTGRP